MDKYVIKNKEGNEKKFVVKDGVVRVYNLRGIGWIPLSHMGYMSVMQARVLWDEYINLGYERA